MQSYLDRMTPEQQQQYLQTQQGILSRIQRKQELNSQIQAQVDAHKQKQQQNLQSLPGSSLPASSLPGSSLQGSSLTGSSLPATLQKISVVPQKTIVPGKVNILFISYLSQGSHMLEKYLNLEGFLEKSLKIKYTLKSTG